MGLDAFVWCRCFEEGRAAIPPVPVRYDWEDGVVPLRELSPAERDGFEDWLMSGCVHPDMRAVSVTVGNGGP